MKNLTLSVALIYISVFLLSGQNNDKYQIWINQCNDQINIKGLFNQAKDSTLIIIDPAISGTKRKNQCQNGFNDQPTYMNKLYKRHLQVPVGSINTIQLRRKRSIGRGILWGSLVGLGGGFLAGMAISEGNDSGSFSMPRWVGGAVTGAVCLPLGALSGGLIGARKQSYPIKGNIKNYEKYKNELQEKAPVF